MPPGSSRQVPAVGPRSARGLRLSLRLNASGPVPRVALLAVVVIATPFAASQLGAYWLGLAIAAVVTALLIESVGVVTDRAGMVALCPMSFAAVGAWTLGYLNAHNWPGEFLLWLVAGGVVAVPVGLLVGMPALRLRGVQLAVITLSFAAVTDSVFTYWGFPGQLAGAYVNRPGLFGSDSAYFVLCWIVLVVVSGGLWLVGRRRIGCAWRAVARSERATAAMGMSVPRTKLAAFMVSALIAGIAGGLLVGYAGSEVPAQFDPLQSLVIVAVAIMVGGGNPDGALLGGVLSQAIPEIFRRIGVSSDIADVFFAVGALMALKAGMSVSAAWRLSARRRRLPGAGGAHDRGPARPRTSPRCRGGIADGCIQLGSRTRGPRAERVLRSGACARLGGPRRAACVGRGTDRPQRSREVIARRCGQRLHPGYRGTIAVGGRSLDALPVHRRMQMGVRRTFQSERTIPELTVGRYILLASGRRAGAAEIRDLLAFLDGPPGGSTIGDIDVGARRIVEIAGMLAARPQVLLLDEPTAGLAEAESMALAGQIRAMPVKFGCSVLLIEHDIAVVRAACERLSVLDFGKPIAHGPTADVLSDPIVADAYLGVDLPMGVA